MAFLRFSLTVNINQSNTDITCSMKSLCDTILTTVNDHTYTHLFTQAFNVVQTKIGIPYCTNKISKLKPLATFNTRSVKNFKFHYNSV